MMHTDLVISAALCMDMGYHFLRAGLVYLTVIDQFVYWIWLSLSGFSFNNGLKTSPVLR